LTRNSLEIRDRLTRKLASKLQVVDYDLLGEKCVRATMPGQSATISKAKAGGLADSTTKTHGVANSKHPPSEAALEEKAARTQAPTSVQPVEPEDASLTEVSRSHQRRLLGLNTAEGNQAKPIPGATVAGIHSTGSYTETQGVKPESSAKGAERDKR
jgi:hypothetical protein